MGERYIYNYILSVVVVRIPSDSETSLWAQSAVSALVEDHLTASIQVVTRRQSPLSRPSASIQAATRRQSLLSRPSRTISRVLVLWICVLGLESMLLERICDYATVYKRHRTRQDTISYSSYRVKIGGGGLWGLDPHWKTDNPHCKHQRKKLGGRVSTPLGPDSCECIHYDIVSFFIIYTPMFS